MSRMIRCIEGHVFDADSHAKCPSCGWTPKKTAKKQKRGEEAGVSFAQRIAAVFNGSIGAVERGLGAVGIKDKPGLAAGIVYAGVILLLVTGAWALPGSRLWPGNWGKATTEASLPSTAAEKEKPAQEKEKSASIPDVTPAPTPAPLPVPPPAPAEQEKSPDKKSADSGDEAAPAEKKRRRQRQQQPHIHVPHEVRRLLRMF